MRDLLRDTILGHTIRLLSRGHLLAYDQDLDLSSIAANGSDDSSPHSDSNSQSSSSAERPTADDDDAEKGPKDRRMVDWVANDPQNPRNWSTAKKVFVTFQICLLTTSVYIGSAIYTAGVLQVAEQFQVSQVVAILGLSMFVLGYALGPMVWAPLSEIPYIGRNPIYIGTLVVFVVMQLGVIYAKNIGMLLAFRFLTGLFGSPVLATGGATIADLFKPSKQAYGIGVWGISAVIGPSGGPVVAGWVAQADGYGWTWTIWELMWLSAFCLLFLILFLPETSSSNILYRRTKRVRALTGEKDLMCEPELEAEGMTGKEIVLMVLVRPFTLSFTEPIVFFLNLYIALVYSLLYTWFESFPIVFLGIYNFNLGELGLAFLGILAGAVIVIGPFVYYVHKYVEPQFNEKGELRPEIRLKPAFVGAFFIPLCLFWFAWTSRASVHWIVPIIGSSFFSIGTFLLFMSVLTYLGDAYPKYVASVFAGNDLVRSISGAAFPLFATAMYDRLGVGWATSLLGFLSVAFIPIPFVLYRYGHQLRLKSKMARHDI